MNKKEIETAILGYKTMFFIREAQLQLQDLYLNNKIFSMVHFYIGQEAIAAGVTNSLRPEDKVLGNHRSHGHYLAKGGDLRKLIAELLGKEAGASRGKGGSMHLIDKSANFLGTSPILGSAVPIATGVAFANKYKNELGITVVFYGDGASEEGVVYKTYNLAALFKLPILFVLENNYHSINSKLSERRSAKYDLSMISKGLGVDKYARVDGNSYEEVFKSARDLTEHIRKSSMPAIMECMTYRHLAHSTPLMDESYRIHDVLDERVNADPIPKLKMKLINSGLDLDFFKSFEESTRELIADDIKWALSSPQPNTSELFNNVFN